MATRLFFMAIALGLIVAAIWAYQHDQNLRKNASQINIGDSNEVVQQLLGDPSSDGDCGAMTPAPNACNDEYIYRYWYSVFQPHYVVIWFDHSGKVLGQQHVKSHF